MKTPPFFTSLSAAALIAGALLSPGTNLASAQTTPAYNVVDLGTLGGTVSHAWGVNNAGQVVGDSYLSGSQGSYHAALFNVDGAAVTRVDLGNIPSSYSTAYGINGLGQIAGTVFQSFIGDHATAWSVNDGAASRTDFGTLGGVDSLAFAINDAGLAVGDSLTPDGNNLHAVLFSMNGGSVALTDLGVAGQNSIALGINDGGIIVGEADGGSGFRATLFSVSGGTVSHVDLGMPKEQNSSAQGINHAGQIVGTFTDGSGTAHAAIYTVNAGTVSRTDLGVYAPLPTRGDGINNAGEIVGNFVHADDSQTAFLYTAADGIRDLNTLVGTGPGATNLSVAGNGNPINDWGQIAVNGTVAGNVHAILLNPTAPVSTVSGTTQETRFLAGAAYDLFPAFRNPNGKGLLTVLTLLDGTAGSGGSHGSYGLKRDVTAFFTGNPAPTPLASDAVNLGGTAADAVVVQLSYDQGSTDVLFGTQNNARLGWFDGRHWVLAVDGNAGGTALYVGNRAYNAATDFHVGTYGINTQAMTVWAVVNHGGFFGVTLDPAALRKITSQSRDGTATFLTMDSYQGHTYQLQRATTLTGSASGFTNTGVPQSGGTGTMYFKYDDGTNTPQAFFRVELDP